MKKFLLLNLILLNFLFVNAQNKLVAYYPFTSNVQDASGNNNNGTSYGATLTTDRCGNENSAYHFDGSSYISLPANEMINPSYSYAMWVSFDNVNSVMTLFSIGGTNGNQGIQVVPSGAGWAGGGYNSNGTVTAAISGKYPSANKWYHVILIRDAASAKLYIDGQLEATGSTDNLVPSYGTAPYNAILGTRESHDLQFFTGKLDEVKIYNYALSGNEIEELYNSYTCDKLVAYYPFTSNVQDASGNNNNGTSYGATLTTDRCGIENSAYHFDGSSYISLPANEMINSSYSYAMWVSFDNVNSVMTLFSIGGANGNQGIQVVPSGAGWAGGGYNSNGTVTAAISGKYPSANKWYHVILIRDAASAKLYIDGQLEATASTDNLASSYGTAPYNAILGARESHDLQFFTGKLDEVKIYNYALSGNEVEELYNSYSCITTSIIDQGMEANLFDLYPNPADGKFFVKYDKYRLSVSNITINNVTGKTVCTIEDNATMQNDEIQLNELPSGIYFVSFKTVDGAIFTKRLLIK